MPQIGLPASGRRIVPTNLEEFEIVGYGRIVSSVGRGGGLTGNKVDIAILDDLYKDAAEGNSPTVRESVWEWYTSAVKTRRITDRRNLSFSPAGMRRI